MTTSALRSRALDPTVAYELRCVECDAPAAGAYHARCRGCGGMLDARYDTEAPLLGPADTLPGERFRGLLPVTGEAAHGRLELHATPLVEVSREFPGAGRVYAKCEGRNPTGSSKDPMAMIALAHMVERGVRRFAFCSTGNSAAAFARALWRWPELTADLVCAAGFPAPTDTPPGLRVTHIDGDYTEAHDVTARLAAEQGAMVDGGFFSVGRREGLKLAYLAALDELPIEPSVIVQAVSSGMGIVAAAKAVAELQALGRLYAAPRLFAVQQASCAPMATAFADGAPELRDGDVVRDPQGAATATLLGDPRDSYPYVRRAALESGGGIVSVDLPAMRSAHRRLTALGLAPCMASATSAAAVDLLTERGWIGGDDVVLVMLTGSSRSAAGRTEVA